MDNTEEPVLEEQVETIEETVETESILNSIKKLLNISKEDKSFDTDIIIHINSVINMLLQLGVGPKEGFRIKDETETWKDYISEDDNIDYIKTYIYLKVKNLFDPPLNSSVLEANKQMASELEWRLNIECDKEE